MVHQSFRLGIVCLLGLGLVGCGHRNPKLTYVEGKVIYKDLPLAGATVSFVRVQGKIASGVTDSSGHFVLKTAGQPGAELGKYKVCVSKCSPQSPARKARPQELKKMKMYQGGKIPTPPMSEIPENYGNPNQSRLEVEVTGNVPNDAFAFILTD